MKRISGIVLLCLTFMFSEQVCAQTGLDDLNFKYWYYRYRLQTAFTVIGEGDGRSLPAACRNINGGTEIRWNDETPRDLGYYLGVLATEYKLLSKASDRNKTLTELYYAMLAAERLDEHAEQYFSATNSLNGFFIRMDVPEATPISTLGLNSLNTMINQVGPDVVNTYSDQGFKAMSQDKIYALWKGLVLVRECLPDQNFTVTRLDGSTTTMNFNIRARDYIANTVEWMKNGPGLNPNWIIEKPDGSAIPMEEGGIAIPYEYPIKIISSMYGTDNMVPGSSALGIFSLAVSNALAGSSTSGGIFTQRLMLSDLLSICDCAPVPVYWPEGTLTDVSNEYTWTPFYLSLWSFIHGHDIDDDDVTEQAREQLNGAPVCGPARIPAATASKWDQFTQGEYIPYGWQAPCKYAGSYEQQYVENHESGFFPGLDYMLLHNLYRLNEYPTTSFPAGNKYENHINAHVSQTYPLYLPLYPYESGSHLVPFEFGSMIDIVAENDITADGDVSYRAGESIRLTPGFHTASGSSFRAYIRPFDCNLYGENYSRQGTTKDMMPTSEQIQAIEEFRQTQEQQFRAERMKEKRQKGLMEHEANNVSSPLQKKDDVSQSASMPFPNPTTNSFKFYNSSPVDQLLVEDISGKVVLEERTLEVGVIEIDLEDYADGIYIMKVISGGQSATYKVVKASTPAAR